MITRRDLMQAIPVTGAAFAVASRTLLEDSPAQAQAAPTAPPLAGHFHPKGKAPSRYTQEILDHSRTDLPFGDTRDFDENRRGLIARMPEMRIMADAGHVAWDM